jgi:hypothetical protein
VLYRNDAGELIFVGRYSDTWSINDQLIFFTPGTSGLSNAGQYTPSTVNCGYSELDRLTGIPARAGDGAAGGWVRFEAGVNNAGAMICWRYKASSTSRNHAAGYAEGIFVTKGCRIDGATNPTITSNGNGLTLFYINRTTGVNKELD